MKAEQLVVLFIDKATGGMSLRPMFEEPTNSENEIFMHVLKFQDACVICNRYNNEVWKKKVSNG